MKSRLAQRLNPFLDVFKTGWENRDQLGYAWRILNNGVCDGCALGTTGMRDWTIDGIHLCWIRLNLLRLNTMPALDPSETYDVSELRNMSEKELRQMGRLSTPLIRKKGSGKLHPITWDDAISTIVRRIKGTDAERLAFYLVSRGTVNETYYVAQKAARLLGTNHIDNSARICHAPSTTALKRTVGHAATTCSYKDMIGSDLIVFFGSNVANNQPVVMKYLHLAKKQGTKVAMVNTFREPGMEKYWVPSNIDSAILGTEIVDQFFQVKPGGDIAFINGVLKYLIEEDGVDRKFVNDFTSGWQRLEDSLGQQSFEELESLSGASRVTMRRFADMYKKASSAIMVWSMGITMHRNGVANVQSIANLALARGMVGKPKCGLMAIRGHSGVQGGAEVGAVPNQFPAGFSVTPDNAKLFSEKWGFKVPSRRGYFASEMIDAAWEGKLDVLYCVGSNLFSVLPDSRYVARAIERIPLRVHHDIVMNQQMLLDPADTILILPATTRYEMAGGNTETTTERRIIFSPEIPGRRIDDARDEWRVLAEIAAKVNPEMASHINFATTQDIREEISRLVPLYQGIEKLMTKGDQIQWGGERLAENGDFPTDDGKAHFIVLAPTKQNATNGHFQLSTRRGKQFNSMEFSDKDPLTGASREEAIMSASDMKRLGLESGDKIVLRSENQELEQTVRPGDVHEGVVVVHWPEANVLIRRGVLDPECGIPAYRDSLVEVLPAG